MNKLLEPTEEMIEAGYQKARKGNGILIIYKAMISKSETIPKLLAALEFYANKDNYLTVHAENPTPNIVMDDGELARETLKDLEE